MIKSRDLILLFICFLCKIASATVCQDTENGRDCTLQSPVETFTIVANRLLVGCSDSFYSLDLGMQTSEHVDLSPAEDTYNKCVNFDTGLGNDPSACKNFVKLVQAIPGDERILVCGTNAFKPKCTIHNISDISSYEDMTSQDQVDVGFSPYSDETTVTASLTSSGRFYSGTRFGIYVGPETIRMAPNPLSGDSTFTVGVPPSNEQWLKQPTFVSSYETDRHIYFFLREPAFEINEGESVVYSRAVRICKSDDGASPSDTNNNFLTFQKARIFCSSDSEQGSIPYIYDNLQSTFLWTEPDGEQFIYGVFTSPKNGPSGSAICKFSFDPDSDGSLTQVFEDGKYLVSQGNPSSWSMTQTIPFSCPGESGPQRTQSDSSQHLLVYHPVTSMDNQPLYTLLGKRISKITIDVISYNGSTQTIVYFSTSEGNIHQFVEDSKAGTQENIVSRIGSPLGHLTIHKNADETRSLYATTENRVMSISLGDCSGYGDCFACLDSGDPYCGWDKNAKMCVNKISSESPVPSLLQSVLVKEEDITGECGERSTGPTTALCDTPTSSTSTDSETVVTENPSGCNNNCTTNTDGLGGTESTSVVSIPDLVGATVGAFVVGIPVGGFVCFIFLKLFRRPRQHKHAINHRRRSDQASTVTQVTNNLNEESQKKDHVMKEPSRYVQTTPAVQVTPMPTKPSPLTLDPPPPGNGHKRKNSNDKDLNTYNKSPEDETFTDQDQVTPLRTITAMGTFPRSHRSNEYGHTVNGVQRKRVPGYMVPRGRTDSTTWLRANSVSSEPASPLTPLDSPISDV